MNVTESVLEDITSKAEARKRRSGTLYSIKALVELGEGWHAFREVLVKMIEVSGNPKMKYYPIQDLLKRKLVVIEESKGGPVGDMLVKLKDEVRVQFSDCINDYIQRLERYRM